MPFEIIAAATDYIQFTDLGVGPVALDLGFFQIRWYSLGYLAAFCLVIGMLLKLIAKPGAPMSREHADDMILYATLGIILGGRIGYILFYQPVDPQPTRSIFSSYGRAACRCMAARSARIVRDLAVYAQHKLSFLRVCDYIACAYRSALFLVRLANFVNGELWGKHETDVPWAMDGFPSGEKLRAIPASFMKRRLEGLLMAAILWPLFWKTDARYKPGFLTAWLR